MEKKSKRNSFVLGIYKFFEYGFRYRERLLKYDIVYLDFVRVMREMRIGVILS